MFKACANKGFSIEFKNGNVVSVQWGPANYCEPTHPEGRNAGWEAPMQAEGRVWSSETAEVAAWDKDGNWHDFGGDTVAGWLSGDDVAHFIDFVANNELKIRKDEDDEEGSEEDLTQVMSNLMDERNNT